MSEIKVNSIKGLAASTAALTINNTDGTCTANITNNLSNRNLIINGAMQVAQRGTSSTTSGYGSVDRWNNFFNGADESPTQAQVDVASGTTPYSLGFRKALKITNGNQTSGAGAGDYINIQQSIEAQNAATSGWNYTSASSFITLSFWIKSSVAQSFKVYLRSQDGTNQLYTFDTGSLTADTWTKITKAIPGNSNIQIDNDNNNGFQVNIAAFWGTDFTASNVTEDAWGTWSSSSRVKDMTSTWYTTNDATLEITGVQLEVGSVATDFEHRSFAEELALCQRYFYMLADHDGQTHNACFGRGESLNSTTVAIQPYYPVTMRDAPSAVTTATASPSFLAYEFNSYYHVTGNWNIHATSPQTGQVYATTNDMGGNNKPMRVQTDASVAKLGFDAEL
tara:strand:+ start:14 stop:1195 length:1182 start_codon:yes stop_codon:yes gene_type:complete